MFEKLLSALPFNPGILDQLSFYYQRVRAERSIRRIGLIFIVLAFLVQFFAFISPSQAALAQSPNDMINGGFNSAVEAGNDCQSNIQNYKVILAYYGVSCAQVYNAPTVTINSDQYNKQLWSMGQLSYNIAGNQPVNIPGLNHPRWVRYLWGWDRQGLPSYYQALNVTTSGGQTMYLLYNCGNITTVGFPQPVKPPSITLTKTTMTGYPQAGSTVKPGTVLGFRVDFSNYGSAATNVHVADMEPQYTTETWMAPSRANSFGFSRSVASWNYSSMPAGSFGWQTEVEFKVNANAPNGKVICNIANIYSDQTPPLNSNQVCFTVGIGPPPPPTLPCQQEISTQNPTACILVSKTATNITEGITNANGTTAQAGDVIKYTLFAKNEAPTEFKNYVFQDNLSYVLDYSSLTDTDGGSLKSNDELVWPGVNIPGGKTVSKTFTIKVDNPIPTTPASASDPSYFNLTMTNTFGNTIVIKLPPTPTHTIQTITTTLPNTGPGTTIMIGAIVIAIAGFFLYRSRLLTKEVKIAVSEQAGEF